MSRQCKCGNAIGHAKAVADAVFRSLMCAQDAPEREDFWRRKADQLEAKFTTDHGKHYSLFLEAA